MMIPNRSFSWLMMTPRLRPDRPKMISKKPYLDPAVFRSILATAMVLSTCASLTPASVIGLWTFEEYSDQTFVPADGLVADSSGNERHLASSGGRFVTPGSLAGTTALSFTGTLRDFLEFRPGFSDFSNSQATASSTDIVFAGTDSYTIEAIATLPHDNLFSDEGGIIGKGRYDPNATTDEWNLVSIDNGNTQRNTLEGFVGAGGDVGNPNDGSFAKPNETNIAAGWHHVALVRNRSTDRVILYLDGVEVANESGPPQLDVSNALGNFVIGGNRSAPLKPYRGSIDMVRISDAALAPAEFHVNTFVFVPEPSGWMLLVMGMFWLMRGRDAG
jgi:hypothetical protein